MRLLKWEWQAFFFKFITSQGSVILSLIRARNADPWAWSEALFFGLLIAVGVDTAKWIYDSKKEAEKTDFPPTEDEP